MAENQTAQRSQAKTVEDHENSVIAETHAAYPFLKIATLNRPRVLNSLDIFMIRKLTNLYQEWEKHILAKCIILQGNGRAFCAGGDVRSVYHAEIAGDKNFGKSYFREEYRLNYLIHNLKTPHVSLINGFVMGGGNGLAMNGKFRVVTENAIFAMPETLIGLHPDVGASYFLSRLPGYFGEYLGLTGARLDAMEMVHLGLGTHYVPSERLASLVTRIGYVDSSDAEVIAGAIWEHSEAMDLSQSSIVHRKKDIDECFSKDSVADIIAALERKVGTGDHGYLVPALTAMRKVSPMSLKVTLRSIRGARQLSFKECLQTELRLSVRAVEGTVSGDFYEGVRALLVDKDGNPSWSPATLDAVSEEAVDLVFSRLPESEELTFIGEEEAVKSKL